MPLLDDIELTLLRSIIERGECCREAAELVMHEVIETCCQALPAGTHCDPQQVADTLRSLKGRVETE